MAIRLITAFELWRPGYANAVVTFYVGSSDTVANLYYDVAGLSPAPNPVALASWEDDCCKSYGRFSQPIYTDAASYSFSVNGLAAGGVHRPGIDSLAAVDASDATVRVAGSSYDTPLDIAFGVEVSTVLYGELVAAEAAANNALLTTCIGVAAGLGGGTVNVPAGSWDFTQLSLPAIVRLRGAGKDVTTLRSTVADTAVELAGDDAGFVDLTLDGVALTPGSVGIETKGYALRLERAKVKRFETNIDALGSVRADWRNVDIDNAVDGIKWFAQDDGDGTGPATGLNWFGGSLTNTTTKGIHLKSLSNAGAGCWRNSIAHVRFASNLGEAVVNEGAQFTTLESCEFQTNIRHIDIFDNDAVTPTAETASLRVFNSTFDDGAVRVDQTALDVIFSACRFSLHSWELESPVNALLLEGCIEQADVSVTGDSTRIQRRRRFDEGGTRVSTTGNTIAVIWQARLEPGQIGILHALVAAVGADVIESAVYVRTAHVRRPGALLDFSNRTVAFNRGQVVRGQTSGATGRIQGATDAVSGTLTLRQLTGTFQDLEIIEDDLGGSGQVDGPITFQDVQVLDNAALYASETDSALTCQFAGSGSEIQVTVNGISGETYEWSADVQLVLTT